MDKKIATEDAGRETRQTNRSHPSWADGLVCLLPLATWLTISWLICCGFHPQGATWIVAIPVSLCVGFVLTFLGAQLIGSGVSTLGEANVACGILLVFVLLMVPPFRAARKAAHKRDALRQTAAKPDRQKPTRPQAIP